MDEWDDELDRAGFNGRRLRRRRVLAGEVSKVPVAMELGSDPVVFKSGDQAAVDEANKGGTPIGGEKGNTTTVIAAVAVVVILAGGIVGGLLYFKKPTTSVPVDAP